MLFSMFPSLYLHLLSTCMEVNSNHCTIALHITWGKRSFGKGSADHIIGIAPRNETGVA